VQSQGHIGPPTTKEFRLVVDQTVRSCGVGIISSRTRSFSRTDNRLYPKETLSYRRKLRMVTYVIDRSTADNDFKKVSDAIVFWFALLDQAKYIKIETYRYRKAKYIISCWCLITPLQ